MSETTYDYPPPVSKLLTVGDVRKMRGWPDYLAMGLTTDQVPDLIRMALDKDLHWAMSDTLEVWAPIHAWRALAQLRAEAAVEPLIELLDRVDEYDDDWISEELPVVFGHIGQAAITPLTHFLADAKRGLWSRITAASSFAQIGERHPDLRAQCVAALTQQLTHHQEQDHALNGFLISYLTDLKAVESASVMEQAFAANSVDIAIQGDWEDTQIQLGLLQERLTPKPVYNPLGQLFGPAFKKSQPPPTPRQAKPRRTGKGKAGSKIRAKLEAASKAKAKARARRKQQKKTHRKRRKRK